MSMVKRVRNAARLSWNWQLADSMTAWYDGIPQVYRRSFWISFVLVNIVFICHTANFLFGNHDFNALFSGISWTRMAMEGRFSNTWPYFLFGNSMLPVVNNLAGFFCMTVGGLLFCRLLRCREKTQYLVLGTLLLSLPPYICASLYYAWMFFSFALIFLLLPMTFLILNKPNIFKLAVASLMVGFCLGIYQSSIGMFAIVFLALCMVECVEFKAVRPWYKNPSIKRIAAGAVAMASGCGLYMLGLYCLRHGGVLNVDAYNLQTASVSELWGRVGMTFENAWKSMTVGQMFLPAFYKYMLLGVMGLGWLSVAAAVGARPGTRGFSHIMGTILRLTLVAGFGTLMFFLIEFSSFVATARIEHTLRILVYTVPPMTLLGYLFALKYGAKPIANIVFCLALLIIWRSIIGDLAFQKNLKLGTEVELMTYQRILSMIEQDPRMPDSARKRLTLVEIGLPYSFRERFQAPLLSELSGNSLGHDSELRRSSFNPAWRGNTGQPFCFLSQSLRFRGSYCVPDDCSRGVYRDLAGDSAFAAFLAQARAYPSPASKCLFINDKYIVIVLNDGVLPALRTYLARLK